MSAAVRHAVAISEIVGGLASRIESLCAQLLPAGHREGREWVVPRAASPLGCAVSVHLAGAKAGVWSAWASGDKGDALDLVNAVNYGGRSKGLALSWAHDWLGHGARAAADPAQGESWAFRDHRTVAEADDAEMRSAAFRIWLSAEPKLAGTPAETYLQSRGIALGALGRQPRALRFHPRLKHPAGEFWPALVAGINDARGRMVAIHRTYLSREGLGKAPVKNTKLTLGGYAGGLIPLWRGSSARPLRSAPIGDRIVLSEGIEDGLSAALAAPEYRVAAAVSLANLGRLELPTAIETVIIAAQNDPWASAASRGLERAIRHFQSEGREVRIARPDRGKDLNDLLIG